MTKQETLDKNLKLGEKVEEQKDRISKETKKWIDKKLKLKNYIFGSLVTPVGIYFLSIIMNKDYFHTVFIFLILIILVIITFIVHYVEQQQENRQIDIDIKKNKADPNYKADLREQIQEELLLIAEEAKDEKLNDIPVATPTSRPYQGSLTDLKSAQKPVIQE